MTFFNSNYEQNFSLNIEFFTKIWNLDNENISQKFEQSFEENLNKCDFWQQPFSTWPKFQFFANNSICN